MLQNKSHFIAHPIGKHKNHYFYFCKPCLNTTSIKWPTNFENRGKMNHCVPNFKIQMDNDDDGWRDGDDAITDFET